MVKGRANAVLIGVAVLFTVAVALKYIYPDHWLASMLLTVAEASLAGGVADWFAVTALFRRPLGFPYHTALIPRNRERIIEGLADAVEDDFLSKQSIKARLAEAKLVDKLIEQTGNSNIRPVIRQVIDRLLVEAAKTIDPEAVARYAERVFKLVLKRQPVAPHIAAAAYWALTQGKGWELYHAIVEEIARLVREPKTREAIFLYLEQLKQKTANKNWLSSVITVFMENIDGINLQDAADALQQELAAAVDELRDKDHPMGKWFQKELAAMAARLETPEWEYAAERWKEGLIGRLDLGGPLTALTQTVLGALGRSDGEGDEQAAVYREYIVDWLAGQVEGYWERFKTSDTMRSQAEEYLKVLLAKIVDHEHHLIGRVAGRALNKLTNDDLNRFIEDKVGEDLEWIRINGVIVGGLAGLGLSLFLKFVYQPYVVPGVRTLFQ
ncbi:hypothetical protein SCACP_39220 [Sporomusa carbonis]